MAKRLGAVVKFKAGVTKAQAAEALAKLSAVLDFPAERWDYVPTGGRSSYGGQQVTAVKRAFKPEDAVHEYESDHGEPAWYIP